MGLIAHVIESRGIPTLVIGTVRDIMAKVPPPRAVFVDHPVGRTFGRPGDRRQHEAVLAKAIGGIPNFAHPGQIRDILCQWEPDGSRSWEVEVREEILSARPSAPE